VIDAEGHVVLEALGFTLQRVGHDAAAITEKQLGEWIYEIQWQRKARQPAVDAQPGATTARGKAMAAVSDDEVGPALCRRLEAAGDECLVVLAGDSYEKVTAAQYRINPARPEDYRQLLAQIAAEDAASCDGIVHLWAAERWSPEGATLAMLQGARRRGCDSALHLVQALAEVNRAPAPRLWVVTVGTQPVGDSLESLSIAHASLWGLAGVIGTENPELRCTRVDLGASGEGEEIQALLNEVLAGDREDQVALRGSERWVPRVVAGRRGRGRATWWREPLSEISQGHPGRLMLRVPPAGTDRGRSRSRCARRGSTSATSSSRWVSFRRCLSSHSTSGGSAREPWSEPARASSTCGLAKMSLPWRRRVLART
jgi:hypothetical protein